MAGDSRQVEILAVRPTSDTGYSRVGNPGIGPPPAGCRNNTPTACMPGRSFRSGDRDCPFGRDQETRPAFSPPTRDDAPRTGRSGNNERPAPGPAGEKRPPGAGRALAGGFGSPAGQGAAGRSGRGDGPCQRYRTSARMSVRAGSGNATRVSPARAARCPVDRQVREQQKASARPGGREARAGGAAGAGRGLWPPGWKRGSGTLWQGRWPLPDRPRRAQAEGFPAFQPAVPCGRNVFSNLSAAAGRA